MLEAAATSCHVIDIVYAANKRLLNCVHRLPESLTSRSSSQSQVFGQLRTPQHEPGGVTKVRDAPLLELGSPQHAARFC